MGITQMIGWIWFAIGILAFFIMAVAFSRLFRTAWRSADRKPMIKRVLSVQPRKNQEWPNNTREADWIAIAAGLGVVFFAAPLIYLACNRYP